MNKVEFSADTGAPRIIIQSNPSWEQWVDICEAVWVTALEGGCNYWMDDLKYDDDRYWVAWKHSKMDVIDADNKYGRTLPDLDIKNGNHCIRNFPIKVYHNADDWESGESEITEGMSFEVITVGINNLPPYTKMSIIDPWTRDIDAEIADQIVQTGLFGSAVYG
jgi:hypothetical protein